MLRPAQRPAVGPPAPAGQGPPQGPDGEPGQGARHGTGDGPEDGVLDRLAPRRVHLSSSDTARKSSIYEESCTRAERNRTPAAGRARRGRGPGRPAVVVSPAAGWGRRPGGASGRGGGGVKIAEVEP